VSEQFLVKNHDEQTLCAEYVCTYKTVINCIPKINEQIKELNEIYRIMKKDDNEDNISDSGKDEAIEEMKIKIKHKIKERNMLYGSAEELLDIIMHLERYLPYEKRYYCRKQAEELSKQTFNKASNVGVVFQENISIQSVEELVHNKILQGELLYIFKSLLTKKQYTCMYMYYYEKYTQEQIADKLVMTRQNVSAHINNSIELIQRSEYLLSLLEYLA
jgi:predicted DNA-binding protein YlxM (UPF0122 family)